MKRILLIGNSGFVGAAIEKRIVHEHMAQEYIGKSISEIDLTDFEQAKKLEPYLDLETVVIMCAAIKREYGDTLENFLKNCQMIGNLCRLIEANPIKKLIYFSSAAVYGEDVHNTEITEKTAVHPTSFYGIGKVASENIIQKTFAGLSKTSSAIFLRPPTIYGPTEARRSYAPTGFVRTAMAGDTLTLWGDGTELREFVFIDDVTKIVSELVTMDFSGVLNLASGTSHSFLDIVSAVENAFGAKMKIEKKVRTKNKVDNAFNNALLKRMFPRVEFTSLADGIQKIIQFDREQKR